MKSKASDEGLGTISRPGLARRWACHVESLKRREKKGLLHPLRFSSRMVRYDLAEVIALEHEAARGGSNRPEVARAQIPGRFVPATTGDHVAGARAKGVRGQPMEKARARKHKGVDVQFKFPPTGS